MDVNSILTVLQQHPYVDVEKDGVVIRKQLNAQDITPDLIRSYVQTHRKIRFIPKKMMGNSPMRLDHCAIDADIEQMPGLAVPQQQNYYPQNGMNGFGGPQQMMAPVVHHAPAASGSSDLYKILYENAKNDLKEMRDKYEAERERRHQAELELSGSKNSVVGDIAQGLAGIAPMLMGGNGGMGVGMGNAPANPAPSQNLTPINDVKLSAIIKYYSTLDDANKERVYGLLARVFTDLSLIDKFMQM